MDNVKKFKDDVEHFLTQNEVDRISINKVLEVIEEAYSLGILHGTEKVWNDYD